MKSATLIALALLATAALGLAAWRYNVAAARLAEERRALDALRTDIHERQTTLARSVEQAQQQTEALNAAVEKSEHYQQEQRALATRGVALANGLGAAAPMKTAMAEFYLTQGKWPRSNADIGMPPASTFANGDVRGVAVRPNGRLELAIATDDGVAAIRLDGSANAAGQISWACTTASLPEIERIAPGCSYRAPATAEKQ